MTGLVHAVVLFGTFAILWFLALFCLLPVGMRSDVDAQSGTPQSPRLALKALAAAVIAAVLWAIFYGLVAMKIVDL